MNAAKQKRTKQPLISTRLQPGVGGQRVTSAVSTACRVLRKAVKTAGRSSTSVTGLKPGANERKHPEITEATYVAGHKLRLVFNDKTERVMDFAPFLRQAQNPMLTQYRQLKKFKSFHLDYGDLMWGDFEMIFPIVDLYERNILKGDPAESAHLVLSDAAVSGGTALIRKTPVAPVSYKKSVRKKTLRHV
jgi:hypothetical protein